MDYIKTIRKWIGHETLFTVGCGVIIENEGKILLQHRTDEDNWCIPGGVMELGETFEKTAKRETFEETGLEVQELELFGIYSGEKCFVEYPNPRQGIQCPDYIQNQLFQRDLKANGRRKQGASVF
ncbi:NUDIX domain-containing protein [Bacillus sp. AG4(2022)]|uniref:NUDIX domain-containing protein n=1 Tax=Bacillus sp. AG4(2022) TaxID=2962594 RepID=UPI00288346F4|nr:NUDIX domain-containing protein [Bacillus sp. AG4(2022)]